MQPCGKQPATKRPKLKSAYDMILEDRKLVVTTGGGFAKDLCFTHTVRGAIAYEWKNVLPHTEKMLFQLQADEVNESTRGSNSGPFLSLPPIPSQPSHSECRGESDQGQLVLCSTADSHGVIACRG